MTESYKTVRQAGHNEVTIQKSRFIGYASPCATEEEAIRYIQAIREQHREARHHCYAYIIGSNSGIMRYSDDGEPGGTAGMPMLDLLKKEQTVNCCVVVVRYFGGILLGTGGLVRAYTQGCKLALEAAEIVRMELSDVIQCRVNYSLWNSIQYALKNMDILVGGVQYLDTVEFEYAVRKKDSEESIRTLLNKTDGKLEYKILEEAYRAWNT
jgi:uncharacterized YigZ family protein